MSNPAEYVPTTPPLRLRPKLAITKKRLSRPNKLQSQRYVEQYSAAELDNQLHEKFYKAACCIQHRWRYYYSQTLRRKYQAQIGRPAQLKIIGLTNADMGSVETGSKISCIVTVIRCPFGPLMYQFKTEASKNISNLQWSSNFFVPVMSTKYNVIITVVSEYSKFKKATFLGQAVLHVPDRWEYDTENNVGMGQYKFPIDVPMLNEDVFIPGKIRVSLQSLGSSPSSYTGQLYVKTSSMKSVTAYMRNMVGHFSLRNGGSYEASLAWFRRNDQMHWGVLTETHFCLYNAGDVAPLKVFDLRKIQLISSKSTAPNNLQIYSEGKLYSFYVNAGHELQQWQYRIDSNRRKLLVP